MEEKTRCFGDSEIYIDYHDNEWGRPVHDDIRLFEMLILEGAQAGLSWITVLKKREAYREAFDGFDPYKVAEYDETKVEELMANAGIIRNRLKINAAIINAKLVLQIIEQYGSFNDFIWSYVNHEPIIGRWERFEDMPLTTEVSDKISKDLKKMGFKFIGSTIIYSFMQAVGMVNDHLKSCTVFDETVNEPSIKKPMDVDEYMSLLPEDIHELVMKVRLMIQEIMQPVGATEILSYSMPTYRTTRSLIHFAAQKNHLGIYPGADAITHFALRLTNLKTSKGAIQFPYKDLDDEHFALISDIAKWCSRKEDSGM